MFKFVTSECIIDRKSILFLLVLCYFVRMLLWNAAPVSFLNVTLRCDLPTWRPTFKEESSAIL